MPYHFDIDALSNSRFNRFNRISFHHQSKKDQQINGIMFVRNSAIPQNMEQSTKLNFVYKYCQLIVSNYLCSASLNLIFEYIESPIKRTLNIK